MAREFFKNLPDTDTPIEAGRLNGLLDGDEAQGNVVVDSIRSKNLLDVKNINGINTVINGLTVTYNKFNKCLKFTGTITNDFDLELISRYNSNKTFGYINTHPGTYTFSNDKGFRNDVCLYNSTTGSFDWIESEDPVTVQISSTITLWEYKVYLYYPTMTTATGLIKIQVEKSSSATDWQPYEVLDDDDSGWHFIDMRYNNYFEPVNEVSRPRYRRIGNIVYVCGLVKAKQQLSGENNYSLFIIPYGTSSLVLTNLCYGDEDNYAIVYGGDSTSEFSCYLSANQTISQNKSICLNISYIATKSMEVYDTDYWS